MATTQPQTSIARRLAALVEIPLENLAGFLLFMMGISGVAIGIRNLSEWLIAHTTPWVALAFVVLAGIVWASLLSLVRPEHLRGAEGKIRPGSALGFVTAAAALWIYVFASLSYILFKLGLVTYAFKGSPDAALPDLCDAYLWYTFDLIPGLDVNTALGWGPDVDMNGGWRGAVLLLFRIVVVFQVFALGRALFKAPAE